MCVCVGDSVRVRGGESKKIMQEGNVGSEVMLGTESKVCVCLLGMRWYSE